MHDWHEGQPCSPTSSSISPHLTLEVGAADMTFRHSVCTACSCGKRTRTLSLGATSRSCCRYVAMLYVHGRRCFTNRREKLGGGGILEEKGSKKRGCYHTSHDITRKHSGSIWRRNSDRKNEDSQDGSTDTKDPCTAIQKIFLLC